MDKLVRTRTTAELYTALSRPSGFRLIGNDPAGWL